jgi:hypothetical protein
VQTRIFSYPHEKGSVNSYLSVQKLATEQIITIIYTSHRDFLIGLLSLLAAGETEIIIYLIKGIVKRYLYFIILSAYLLTFYRENITKNYEKNFWFLLQEEELGFHQFTRMFGWPNTNKVQYTVTVTVFTSRSNTLYILQDRWRRRKMQLRTTFGRYNHIFQSSSRIFHKIQSVSILFSFFFDTCNILFNKKISKIFSKNENQQASSFLATASYVAQQETELY